MRMLLISFLKNLSDRLYAIKFQTAQERYELLLKNYPQILLRVPLGHVASFLGITQQTLSVIRAGNDVFLIYLKKFSLLKAIFFA